MHRTSPRFDPDTLGDQDRVRQDRRVVLTIVLCVMLGMGAALWAQWAKPGFQDVVGAPLQSATGRVTHVSYAQEVNEYGSRFHLSALEVDGRELDARDARLSGELKKGQRVRFTYLAGRSGWWHIQSIQPE